MKNLLLAGASLLALVGHAQATAFSYTGTFQLYTVPVTGLYDFEVFGAQGGDSAHGSGGQGAEVSGEAVLPASLQLAILVGGAGQMGQGGGLTGGGGGGASGVFAYGEPGFLAGGGGGAGYTGSNGGAGQAGLNGQNGQGANGGHENRVRSEVKKTPGVSGGAACVRDTRIPVWTLVQ